MRSRRTWGPLTLLAVVAALLAWNSRREDDPQTSGAQNARIRAAIDVHNASFAPSRETLRAWALFDDVRCTFRVTSGRPGRVLLAATLDSGTWLLISIDEDEVDYDSYRQGSALNGLEAASGSDAERLFSEGEPCSVRDEGILSSP